jgi:ergothioneine biosynthesis protein EgtB
MKRNIDLDALRETWRMTRRRSVEICAPLKAEDHVPQPITDVSPPKWHLAHSSWFFEQFVLVPFSADYRVYHPDYAYLFNSYYNHKGKRVSRADRGFMTRPTVDEILAYRAYVDEKMERFFEQEVDQKQLEVIEIGTQHEQQHQELLVYDIKYILGSQPTHPVYGAFFSREKPQPHTQWVPVNEGICEIGADGTTFCFDNELARHKVYLPGCQLRDALITNGEFLEFVESGAYENFDLWHADGWDFLRSENIQSPLYWTRREDQWHHYTLEGLQPLPLDRPVQHVSFYEAFAFAEWAGWHLPTEFEWEAASGQLDWGHNWEWTNSAYLPYPGFSKAPGALGEYNGKFMVNQMVLRGASAATTPGHSRPTYRNFFYPGARWIFSGIRVAKS